MIAISVLLHNMGYLGDRFNRLETSELFTFFFETYKNLSHLLCNSFFTVFLFLWFSFVTTKKKNNKIELQFYHPYKIESMPHHPPNRQIIIDSHIVIELLVLDSCYKSLRHFIQFTWMNELAVEEFYNRFFFWINKFLI